MHHFRVWWNSFKTIATIVGFIIDIVVIIVLLLVVLQIFHIKNGILEPLIDGLHANFVGLDEAVIERTIEVDDEIPVVFDLPLNQSTNVVLTQDVPIAANASFTLPGGGGVINGRVDIVLPQGLVLPVQLDMMVPVNTNIPINLPVDVSIPLNETQLHEPFDNLRELLEPYVRLLDNTPEEWDEVPDFTIDAVQGQGENVLRESEDSADPWPPAGEDESGSGDGTQPQTGTGQSSPATNGEATPTFTPFPTLTPAPISPTATPQN